MQFGFFRIPLAAPEPHTEDVNRFLRTHRILCVQRGLVPELSGAYWAVCVARVAQDFQPVIEMPPPKAHFSIR